MACYVVISSDLLLSFLKTRVKTGAKLPTGGEFDQMVGDRFGKLRLVG